MNNELHKGLFKEELPNYNREFYKLYKELWYEKVESQNHYQMVAFLKSTNEPIADIGFDRNDNKLNSVEASCWLHPNYWGKGYMKEAMIKSMEFIFNQGFDNIIAGYIDGNIRSKKLQESLGFEQYRINDEFSTNYGRKRQYINIMSKEKFHELYKNKIKK